MTKAKSKSVTKPGIADALLDAHVAFIVEQIGGKALQGLIEKELDALLADAARLRLGDAVTPAMIKETVRVFAVELEPGPGIPELVGEIARALYAHPLQARTRLGDLLSDRRLKEVLDKLLEFDKLRENLIHEAIANPLYSAFVADLLYDGIRGYLADNAVTRRLPGASSMMKLGKGVMGLATPRLEQALEDQLKKYIGKTVQAPTEGSAALLLKIADKEALREAALAAWSRARSLRISTLQKDVGSDDIEELFVIGYEFWRELRHSDYYIGMIDAGIDAFFDKYATVSLRELLDDLGISRQMMLDEAMRYAPPVIRLLKRKKMLEPMIRRNLEPFYRSGAIERVLG